MKQSPARGHVFLPEDHGCPPIMSQAEVRDPTVHLKFFTPLSDYTWLITEYDPVSHNAFGFAGHIGDEMCAELGSVNLEELEGIKYQFGMPAVERDCWWTPKPLTQAVREEFGFELRRLGGED